MQPRAILLLLKEITSDLVVRFTVFHIRGFYLSLGSLPSFDTKDTFKPLHFNI
jgi:hypothetical protein